MNIGGTSTGATPTYDGEMTPKLQLTGVPYAFRAGGLAKLTGVNTSTLGWASQTAANNILLPDEAGTICIQNSANCGFLTGSAASGSYVQLQGGSPPGTAQTGNFNISGTGIAGILQAATIDTSSAVALQLGTTNATAINLNQNVTIATGKTLTVQGTALFKPSSDSPAAFQVQGSLSTTPILNVDTSNSRVGVGTASPQAALHVSLDGVTPDSGLLFSSLGLLVSNSTSQTNIEILTASSNAASKSALAGVRSRGTVDAPTKVLQGDSIFSFQASGYDGSNRQNSGSIDFTVDGATSAGTVPMAIGLAVGTSTANRATVLTLSSIGAATFQNRTDSPTGFQVQNAGGNSILSVDTTGNTAVTLGKASTLNGTLIFANATNGNTATLQSGTTSASYTTTLPAAIGTAGQCLAIASVVSTTQTLGYAACGGGTGGTGSYVTLQGGSPPGTPDTGNFNIDGTGIADILQGTTKVLTAALDTVSAGTLSIGNVSATTINIGTNAAAHTIAIGNGAAAQVITIGSTNTTSALTLQAGSAGITINGSSTTNGTLTFTGSATTSYTTPHSTPVSTKINIQNYDPGDFGQVLALGIPLTSAYSTSRVISVFDGRTGLVGIHQPSIALFSPGEDGVFGLSWDGSDSNALLKTTNADSTISLRPGNLNQLALTAFSTGHVRVGATTDQNPIDGTAILQVQDDVGLAANSGNGYNGTMGIRAFGVTGGDTTGTTGQVGGTGGGLLLQAGNGGSAVNGAGGVNGNGGSITLSAGAAGNGFGATAGNAGSVIVKNQGDGSAAFQVQSAAGNNILTVNSTAGSVLLGKASTLAGVLVFANATNGNTATLQSGTTSASYTTTLPAAIGTAGQCLYVDSVVSVTQTLGYTACGGGGGGANTSLSNIASTNLSAALNVTSGNLTVQTTTSGNVVVNAAGTIELQSNTNIGGNVTIAAGKSLTVTGGSTRPGAPTEGMLFYDTTTKQLLVYANGKWQADRTASTKLVAASNSTQAEKDAADYVATGTGDQAKINSALTDAAGGTVYLFEGTYTISAAISVPNNTTLAGAGASTIITLPNAQNGSYNMITNTDTATGTGVTISNLKIDGNKANQTAGSMSGVYLINMGDSSTNRAGARIEYITAQALSFAGVAMNAVSNTTLTGNQLNNNDIGITSYNLPQSNNIISSNITNNNNSNGIIISNASYITVRDNTGNNTSYGIQLSYAKNSTIVGNKTTGNYGGIYMVNSSNNTITANSSYADGEAISINSSNNNSITSNTADGSTSGSVGVSVSSSSYNTISSNTIRNGAAGGSGISIDSTSSSNSIIGNNLSEIGGTNYNNAITTSGVSTSITGNTVTDSAHSVTNYAISIESAASGTYVSNNSLGTGSVHDVGTGTIFGGQQDSTGAYVIQPAGNKVQIGSSVSDATANLLGVDSYNNATDPTGFNGAIYYNSNAGVNKFRCYQNGAWTDCIGSGGSGANTSLSNIASTNLSAALNVTSGNLTVQTTTSGNIVLSSAGTIELQSNTNISGNTTVKTDSSSAFSVQDSSSSPVLTVDTNTGRVGIGTDTPAYALDVVGNTQIKGDSFNVANTGDIAVFSVDTINNLAVLGGAANSTSGNTINNAMGINFDGNYWDGSTATHKSFTIQQLLSTSGVNSRLAILNNAGTEVATFNDDGSVSFLGAFSSASTINSASGFKYNGTAGTTTTCTGGDFLQDATIQGGIITGVTCATGAGGGSGVSSLNTQTGAILLQGMANQITVNTVGTTITLTTPQDINTASNVTFGALTVNNSTNGVILSSTGIQLKGTAQPTRTIKLTPEFAGAIFHADGTQNVGYMTSDYESGHNFYAWTTDQGPTSNDYDIIVQYQLPSDFDGFAGNFKLWDYADTGGGLTYMIRDGSATDCYSGFQTATVSASWQQRTLTDPSTTGLCTFAANDTITIVFRPSSDSSDGTEFTKISTFQFDYKAKF
jgi:parallel beta-helix repeat protein